MIIEQRLNHGGPQDLYVRPVARRRTDQPDRELGPRPGPARWSPDSRFIYFTRGIGGESHLFRVSVPGGTVEQVTTGPRRLNGLSYDHVVHEDPVHRRLHDAPADLYIANIDGSNERRLTNVHRRS